MTDIIQIIKEYLIGNGYKGEGLASYLNDINHGSDNQKAEWYAATTPATSGIIKFGDIKYYFYCIKPWLMCPEGSVTVELHHA